MNPNKKAILISIIFGVLILALIYFGIYPLVKEIKKSSQDFVAARRDLALIKDKTGSVAQLTKIYQEIEPDFKKIEDSFIDPEVPINLIQFFEKAAADSNVSISISPLTLKKEEKDSWSSMGFQIRSDGSFLGFLRFLKKVENGTFSAEIQNLSIRRLTDQDIKNAKEKNLSLGAIEAIIVVKAFTNSQ